MNISVKDMLVSFAIGLVVFSLIMVALCCGIFNSQIKVAKAESPQNEVAYKIDLHKSVIFAIPEKEGDNLYFSVLVMIDQDRKEMYLTPVYGDLLMNYRDSLSYVSGVYEKVGSAALTELVRSFSGLSLEESAVISFKNVMNFTEFKTELYTYFSQNNDDFLEMFECDKQFSEFKLIDFPLVTADCQIQNTHQMVKTIDVEKSVSNFKSILG